LKADILKKLKQAVSTQNLLFLIKKCSAHFFLIVPLQFNGLATALLHGIVKFSNNFRAGEWRAPSAGRFLRFFNEIVVILGISGLKFLLKNIF